MRSLLAAVIVSFAVHAACQTISPAEAKEHTERQIVKVEHEISASGVPFHATWNSLAAYRTPDWFRDAKFGIFLHWGVYSVPAFGNEWYSRNMYVPGSSAYRHHVATYGPQSKFGYKDFIPMFKAEHFNANAWADLFVKAGARYVVPVGEHCDGFAMYDSDITPWNAARMGPHRDVVGELAKATRARGLRFGVSSHTAEHWWWYGRGRSFPSDVRDETPETALLYGPAAPMNLPRPDGTTIDTKEPDPSHLEEWLAPNAAFTDNWLALSTEIVDKYQPDFMYFDWWTGQPAMKSALQKSLIAQLVDTVSKNGNLLLNVGPKADGTIPQEVQSALLQMGEWLRINGEAIYGSRPFAVFGEGPTKAPKDSTQKDKDIQSYTAQDIRYTTSRSGVVLYATALGWPSGGNLVLHTLYAGNPYLTDPICSVRLLGSLREIPFAVRPDGLHLTLPQTPPPGLPRDIAWSFAIRTHCHE